MVLYVFFAKIVFMKLAVIASTLQREEWLAQGLSPAVEVQWLDDVTAAEDANAYIDLLFTFSAERIAKLKNLQPAVIIINDVITTLDKLPQNFVRINGWPDFLNRTVVEAACNDAGIRSTASAIFSCFNKTTEWVPDTAGLISARVLAMIINEAYLTLGEGVSSKEAIDTAMKLGTNYPFGPFEWGNKIGLKNIYHLLTSLSETNTRYEPATLLKKEALY